MREGVTGKQEQLKYEQTSGPDGWRAAKNRQDLLSKQKLHLEEQECAQENSNSVRRLRNRLFKFAFDARTRSTPGAL